MKLLLDGDVNDDEELEIIVEDKEKRGADLIGHCKTNLKRLLENNHDEWIYIEW